MLETKWNTNNLWTYNIATKFRKPKTKAYTCNVCGISFQAKVYRERCTPCNMKQLKNSSKLFFIWKSNMKQ